MGQDSSRSRARVGEFTRRYRAWYCAYSAILVVAALPQKSGSHLDRVSTGSGSDLVDDASQEFVDLGTVTRDRRNTPGSASQREESRSGKADNLSCLLAAVAQHAVD